MAVKRNIQMLAKPTSALSLVLNWITTFEITKQLRYSLTGLKY
jgi:hypothetical protein